MTTIKDIAKACGVSNQAVSYALNNTGRLSSETRELILEKARELRYFPNTNARRMLSGKTGAVGLLYARKGFAVPEVLLDTLIAGLEAAGLELKLYRLPSRPQPDDAEPPKVLREIGVDGFLVMDLDPQNFYLRELIRRHRLPAVWLNEMNEKDAIYPNDKAAAEDATRELIDARLKRILYLNVHDNRRGHFSIEQRMAGYMKAMEAAGLKIDVRELVLEDQSYSVEVDDPRKKLFEKIIAGVKPPFGVVAYNELSAEGLAFHAERAGLRCGKDVRIHTFYGSRFFCSMIPIVVHQIPHRKIGELAVKRLLKLMEKGGRTMPRKEVNYETTFR